MITELLPVVAVGERLRPDAERGVGLELAEHVATGEDPQPGVDVHDEHVRTVESADGVVVPAAEHHARGFTNRVDPEPY